MAKPPAAAPCSTRDIDEELRRLGINPIEFVVRGRVFMAALAENIRLRKENARLRRERRA